MHKSTLGLALTGLLVLSACTTGDKAADGAQAPTTSPVPAAASSSSAGGTGTAAQPSATVPEAAAAVLAKYGVKEASITQVIDKMDRLGGPDRPKELMASIRPGELLLSADGKEVTAPMPEQFYVSVAPFENQTHECFFHSLTTCQGELVNTPVKVTVTGADGKEIYAQETKTFANGFVGMWLPRGISGTLTVSANGKTGSVPITTNADSATCITTLKLA